MAELSAGILLFRRRGELEVFAGHMGGPFWARKDERAWSIPKGLIDPDEPALDAARREFAEEVGSPAPAGDYVELGTFRYRSGKSIIVFAVETDAEYGDLRSNTFELEWPPHSGRMQPFPELDRAEWMPPSAAEKRLVSGQVPILAALLHRLT